MGRPREPIDLLLAKGKARKTKAEIERRRAEEINIPPELKNVTAPDYLPDKLKAEFDEIARKLLLIGIITELDEDALARYLLAKQQYLQLTSSFNKMAKVGTVIDLEKVQRMQDKAFQQCRASANDLGLTVKSRANLVMPKVEEPKPNKFSQFNTG